MSKIKTKDVVTQGVRLAENVGRRASQAKNALVHTKDAANETQEPQQNSAEEYAADTAAEGVRATVSAVPQTYHAVQHTRDVLLRPKTRQSVQDAGAQASSTSVSSVTAASPDAVNSMDFVPHESPGIKTRDRGRVQIHEPQDGMKLNCQTENVGAQNYMRTFTDTQDNSRTHAFMPAAESNVPNDAPRIIGCDTERVPVQSATPAQQRKQLAAHRQMHIPTPTETNALSSGDLRTLPATKGSTTRSATNDITRRTSRSSQQIVRPSAAQPHTSMAITPQVKQKPKANTKPARRTVKTAQRAGHIYVKTANATAAQAKRAATKAAQTVQKAKQIAEAAAKAAAQAAKQAAKATAAAVKAILLAAKSLVAALVAGGSVSIVVILVVLMIGLLLGSGFGIFFANDVPDGTKLSTVVQELSDEYYEQIRAIEQRVPHDYVEYEASDGITAIVWPDVLSVYAAQTAIDPANGMEVVTITPEKRQKIRDILWDMNRVSHRTYTTQREIEVEKLDEDGEPYLDTEIITETHLVIEITRKLPPEMASAYAFNAEQQEQLSLLLDPQYGHLWVRLLGNMQPGGSIGGANDGEIMQPGIGGSGTLAWPLPIQGSITSNFGYRKDPFSGKWDFHRGLDISAPNGTPILAAADGTVVVANATDSWGYSWGYYVKLQHAGGMTTLYAHCSALAVSAGQHVRRGEVIAYVGSTGASTGNHLHWEVAVNGTLGNASDWC